MSFVQPPYSRPPFVGGLKLFIAIDRGASEEDGGGLCACAGRADRHPPFVLLALVGVLDPREAACPPEGERFVIVPDDVGGRALTLLDDRVCRWEVMRHAHMA